MVDVTDAVVSNLGAVEFFLGLWVCLPYSIQQFITLVFACVLGVAVIRVVKDD